MLGDRYAIGEVVGRGGMAEVHEAQDLRLGRRVAIKILRPDLARDPAFQTRFRREAQSAAALNHPNIVAVYDTGEDLLASDAGVEVLVPYIVMEFVDGMTLRQILARGRRLLPERALEITARVLSALDYAHRHGIVHRDIKPGNVMLNRSGDVKVMDFGIARALNETTAAMTATSAVMGTAQYLSPEQARGEVVDARSDIYSAGVLLYELLTGQPPFTGDSAVAIAYQHVSEIPAAPSQVDPAITPEIDAVVLTALAKRPEDRYQSANEFRLDVERVIAGGPATAAVQRVTEDHTRAMPPVEAAGVAASSPRRGRDSRSPARLGFWVVATLAVLAAIAGAVVLIPLLLGGSGGARVEVPDLDGLTITQAEQALDEVNLKLGAQTPQLSDRPTDTVIDQSPRPGEMLEQGQPVSITVSSGREQATVPQLIGLTSIPDVQVALDDAGLRLGPVTPRDSEQPPGYVLEQSPVAGTQVDAQSIVSIVVSSGNVLVPSVVGKSEAQARSDIVAAGFNVEVSYQQSDADEPGRVLSQSPDADTPLGKGATVAITVAKAPPAPTFEPTPVPTEGEIGTEVPVPPAG